MRSENYILFFLSLALIAALAVIVYLLRIPKKPAKSPDHDARLLLRDLMAGEALVQITRIAPEDVFLRSPRDRG